MRTHLESGGAKPHLWPMSMPTLHDRAILRLSPQAEGEDVRGFLQGLVTQDVTLVQPGAPQWAGLLTPQGKRLFDFFLWADGEDILIDCAADEVDALKKRLSLYRLRRKIGIERDDMLFVGWTASTSDASQIRGAAPDPRLPDLGTRFLTRTAGEDASQAYRVHRLALGVTEGPAELGQDKILWLETNAADLNGVSFVKGCYIGQENTARMNWRQKINRRMVVVPITEADDKRQMAAYPDLGLSVEHRRVEDIDAARQPAWLQTALSKE